MLSILFITPCLARPSKGAVDYEQEDMHSPLGLASSGANYLYWGVSVFLWKRPGLIEFTAGYGLFADYFTDLSISEPVRHFTPIVPKR